MSARNRVRRERNRADKQKSGAMSMDPRAQAKLRAEEYGRGLHPLWQIHPNDRPPIEVQRDLHGTLQDWLAENAPGLTLKACATSPPAWPEGKRLRIPGDGRTEFVELDS